MLKSVINICILAGYNNLCQVPNNNDFVNRYCKFEFSTPIPDLQRHYITQIDATGAGGNVISHIFPGNGLLVVYPWHVPTSQCNVDSVPGGGLHGPYVYACPFHISSFDPLTFVKVQLLENGVEHSVKTSKFIFQVHLGHLHENRTSDASS